MSNRTKTPGLTTNRVDSRGVPAAWRPRLSVAKAETEALTQGGAGRSSQAEHAEAHGDGGVAVEVIRSEEEQLNDQCKESQSYRRSPIPYSPASIQDNNETARRSNSTNENVSTRDVRQKASTETPYVLIMSFLAKDNATADIKSVTSIERYKTTLKAFVNDSKDRKTLYIVHILTVNKEDRPVIGSQEVSETELYRQLSCWADEEPRKVCVFQLTCQLEETKKLDTKICEPTKLPDDDDNYVDGQEWITKRTAYSGMEVYRFAIPSGANLQNVHDDLGKVVKETCDMSGEEIAGRIMSFCVLNFIRMTLFPSGIMEPSDGGSKQYIDSSIHQSSSRLNILEEINSRPSTESEVFDLGIGVVITRYKDLKKKRQGCNKDSGYITEIAKGFGCTDERIHILNPEDGHVTKTMIIEHVKSIVSRYNGDVSINYIYLFVSAHGNKEGFKTSNNETVQLTEILKPLQELNAFVVLFYHACRGDKFDTLDFTPYASIEGVSFDAQKTSGCSLPLDLRNCAAIYASPAGFKSFRSTENGSSMLIAIRDVITMRPTLPPACWTVASILKWATQFVNLCQLQLQQNQPNGASYRSKSDACCFQCFLQLQLTMNCCSNNQ